MRKKISAALGTSLVLGMFMVPSCVFADEDTINVTVSVYDYNATDYKIAAASEDGVILDKYSVELPAGTTDLDAVKKALEDYNISITVSPSYYGGSYVSEINGLAEMSNPDAVPDYSGWMVAFNGSFDNYGIGALGANGDGILSEGDSIEFHYSVDGGSDIGSSYSGNPILTSFTVGDKTVGFTKTITYDENYNSIFSFTADNAELTGEGTEEKPFEVKVSLGELESDTLPVSYKASRYFNVEGISDTWKLDAPLEFTVSTQSGLTSHYAVTADYSVKPQTPVIDNNPSAGPETGDTANLYILSVAALLAAAGALMTRRYKEN